MAEYTGPRAITTVYNGFRFRSRLEARWAVFFDALGVKYEYEKEGFQLPSGWYLPDFFLPDMHAWFEVKGQEPDADGPEWQAARELAYATEQAVYLFSGQLPRDARECSGLQFPIYEDDYGQQRPYRVDWFQCPVCTLWQIGPSADVLWCGCLPITPNSQPGLREALLAARQARFEFGETPKPTRAD